MQSPQVLVIDDSLTIRKMVECHLSQAGYRVLLAPDADSGLAVAQQAQPDLILLDHQLPGTTGVEVAQGLLESEATAGIPVVISSALRNRAFASYTDLPNVVDQIPKPFTPELLKSGVSNALETGLRVVRAQREGTALPDVLEGEANDSALEGDLEAISLRAVFDFLNNAHLNGQLTVEVDQGRIRFALSGGRIQAAVSGTITPEQIQPCLPPEMSDLTPMLSLTLAERQDARMSGMVRLLEQSLSDPRRLRALLRVQAAILTYWAMSNARGRFRFETQLTVPPMYQAFPLQISLPALLVEGARRCADFAQTPDLGEHIFARQTPRGGNLDRAGLSPTVLKLHAMFDGSQDLETLSRSTGLDLIELAAVAQGLALSGLVERRTCNTEVSILVLEDDAETVRAIQRVLGGEGSGYQLKLVRDRVGAQLLMRRSRFDIVLMAFDHTDQEPFYQAAREQTGQETRYIGIVGIQEESQIDRIDTLGLDGIIHRPVNEADLADTVRHLLQAPAQAIA